VRRGPSCFYPLFQNTDRSSTDTPAASLYQNDIPPERIGAEGPLSSGGIFVLILNIQIRVPLALRLHPWIKTGGLQKEDRLSDYLLFSVP